MENKYAHSDFDRFYLEYSPKLWRLAYRLTRNRYDSEDLVDEAFLIYLQKSTTMVIDNPEAYITRILANLVRNYARLSWHNELSIDVLPESTLSTDGVGMRLREVLPKGLSPQEQEILLLRYEERLSYSEIADVLKIKEASCRSRLMRAKAHLLSLYEKEKILWYMQTSVYKGYKQDKIEMRGDRAEMSDFPLYLNTVAGGLDCRDQTIGGFSFVVKIYAVPVVEIIG